ncbi:MAG: FHA domain-containing protein [Anaerolineales bacterium]
MSRRMRAYYYAVLGAMGGLIGWQGSNLLGLSFVPGLFLNDAIVGGLIGLTVGGLIGATEGIMSRSPARAARTGAVSAGLGLVAGGIGLPLAEAFFLAVGGGWLARAIGWALIGLLIGLAEGWSGGSQVWKAALGGVAGGFIGGALLELARVRLEDTVSGKGLGLVLLGAAIGAGTALISVILSRAWLEVTSGKLKGTEFILDKFVKKGGPTAILGSDGFKADIVLPDPDVAPQHAMLHGDGSRFLIKDLSMQGTFVNRRRIEQAPLSDGQQIRVGNTDLVYHERR